MDKYVIRDGQLFRGDGSSGIVLYGTGVILRELNALQKRVEELEMNIKEAVKDIELEWLLGVAGADGNRDDVYQSGAGKVLDILRKHGVVEDK